MTATSGSDGRLVAPGPFSIRAGETFRAALERISESNSGIALVVDHEGRLAGVLTDGDARRAILAGVPLESPVERVMTSSPVCVQTALPRGQVIRLFSEQRIGQLPVIDAQGRLAGVYFEADFRKEAVLDLPVVIMAGGAGMRLRPLTETLPKPMLPIGGRPLIERLVAEFVELGVVDFFVTVCHLADVIERHFQDHAPFNARIEFVRETEPQGTAGSLRCLRGRIATEFLLVNADVLATLDFHRMREFHRGRHSDATVAVRRHDMKVPYGVVNLAQDRLIGISEKPELSVYVNAGIYMMQPDMLDLVPPAGPFDMTDLLTAALRAGRHLQGYVLDGPWTDIGRPEDYRRANGAGDGPTAAS